MNPRIPKLLEAAVVLTERVIGDHAWAEHPALCEALPLLTAEVELAKLWPADPGERRLVNETTGLMLQCCGIVQRIGPFGDAALAARYRHLAACFLPFARADLALGLALAARPSP